MVLDGTLLAGGLLLLLLGGELLVRGAGGLALLARVTPAVVGLTVVAAGTSMPEMVVSVRSALAGSPGLAIGNIVGSNIFNVSAILGLTALVRPLRIQGNTVRREWPLMMAATVLFLLLMRNGQLGFLEGALLTALMTAFLAYSAYLGRHSSTASEEPETVPSASCGRTGAAALVCNLGAVAVGVAVLAAGASLLVRGAVGLASVWGVSETFIGIAIVGAGTSAPELVTSLVAAWRGRDDLAVANLIGSNIFNVLGIGGVTALVRPLPVPESILTFDIWWLAALSLLLLPLLKSDLRINRAEGGFLLASYISYLTWLILHS